MHPRAKFSSLPALRTPPRHGCHCWGGGWLWALQGVPGCPRVFPLPGGDSQPSLPCLGTSVVLSRAGVGVLLSCKARRLQDFSLKVLER